MLYCLSSYFEYTRRYTNTMKEYWVYILRCSDGSYYTGMTNNIEQRYQQHQEGIEPQCYTFKRRPVGLLYQYAFREVKDAISAEKQIQGWSRKKKEALIAGKTELLHDLSMSTEKRTRIGMKNASSSLAHANRMRSFRSA
jgi:putative endonuclease